MSGEATDPPPKTFVIESSVCISPLAPSISRAPELPPTLVSLPAGDPTSPIANSSRARKRLTPLRLTVDPCRLPWTA